MEIDDVEDEEEAAVPENHSVDESFMRRCLELAIEACDRGDAPVGSIIVRNGLEIAAEGERVDSSRDLAAHAELEAVRSACRVVGSFDLTGCVLYTTVEPCFLCAYSIRETRIARVVYGAPAAGVGGVTSAHPILTADDIARVGDAAGHRRGRAR